MEVFEQFTGMYPLNKCLGLKLDPAEQTKNKECLQKLIEADKKLAEDAEKMKEMIDRYHRQFIQKCLSNFELKLNSDGKNDSLEDYFKLISKRERERKENEQFNKVKSNLRKQIADAFKLNKKGANYKGLFTKALIQTHLINIAESEEERAMIKNFKNFNTYFEGFYKNRENMYSAEEKSTAIAYRLINENLPIFCNNMISFEKIRERDVVVDIDFPLPNDINIISEIFELSYFTKLLIQDPITKYNDIVSKINENVNLYNQQQGDKKNRLPLFKKLKRMILSDKVAVSWLPEKFSSDKEMIDAINKAIDNIRPILDNNSDKSLKFLLQHIGDYDLSRIYISSEDLPYISKCMFELNDVFTNGMKAKKRSKGKILTDKSVDKWFKSCKSFSIEELNTVEGETSTNTIENYFANLKVYDREEKENDVDIFEYINRVYKRAKDILDGKHKDLNKSDDDIKRLKDLLDAFKTLQHLVKPLFGDGDEVDKDNEFYAKLNTAWDALSPITPLYDMVRNWLVRKPYSTKKITLNFGYPGTLLNGWPDSKTDKADNGTQYGGYLFRKKNGIGEYDYYLGISSDKYLFRTPCKESERGEDNYERLNYYQIKLGSFSRNSYNGDYSGDKERLIVVIKDFISVSTDDNFKKESLSLKEPTEYIKFLKDYDYTIYENLLADKEFQKENETFINKMKNAFRSISRIPKAQEFANKQYALFTEVMDDMKTLLLERIFEYFPVGEKEMKEAIEREEKALYLFKITNKDLSFADSFIAGKRKREKRGRDNLHTMYFKALMSGEKDIFDLGTGEVFFREKTEGLKIGPTHEANIPIRNKNKSVQERRPTSTFPYGLVKDKRYTEDIFQFHLSFVQNYKASTPYINPMVNEYLKSSKDTHIIGIDRGERNLLYYVVIDQKGNIIDQQSLNEIKKEDETIPISTDYHDLLEERAKDIREARRNWQTIESIKELKEGHLSQAIHKITELMIKYNAVVVLEYLNPDFVRSRQKREIQEYSKFERMLANKLQYLVDKKRDFHEIGGVLKGYQLTNDIEKIKNKNVQNEFKYQNGFLFYVPAWNTSKIDPITGFVNQFDTRFKGEEEARKFFSQFDSIRYNAEKDLFEFSFDYDNFTDKARDTQTKWTLCTYGKRIKTFRNPAKNNQWDDEEIVLTNEFKKAFADADIDVNGNLKEGIGSLTDKKCLEQLMHLMTLLLQMRNSRTGTEIDYLLSPVADADGNFYDSSKPIASLPKDADANGAYNIARKGLWAIRKIQSTPSGERPKLAISNKEWLQFAQQKPYLDD